MQEESRNLNVKMEELCATSGSLVGEHETLEKKIDVDNRNDNEAMSRLTGEIDEAVREFQEYEEKVDAIQREYGDGYNEHKKAGSLDGSIEGVKKELNDLERELAQLREAVVSKSRAVAATRFEKGEV